MTNSQIRLSLTVILSMCLSTLMACGELQNTNGDRVFANGSRGVGSSAGQGLNTHFNCHNIDNVFPQMTSSSNTLSPNSNRSAGLFEVCESKEPSNISDLYLNGTTQGSDGRFAKVCVFPLFQEMTGIQSISSSTKGVPLSACTALTEDGATVSFPVTLVKRSFNAVAIVEEEYKRAMEICIANGFGNPCPPYSIGEFR